VEHARVYAEQVSERFGLGPDSKVIEVASNDGYLLKHFVQNGIPVLGIEPAANVAEVAEKAGIPSIVRFFGTETARDLVAQGITADLLIGNNVLAHVPELNDFVAGLQIILAPGGVLTMEFPHLLRLMQEGQFDTIYHEHFSYLSLVTVQRVFAAHGLTVFDVEELPTHGGSLRVYARQATNTAQPVLPTVDELIRREVEAGLTRVETYTSFGESVKRTKEELLSFLAEARQAGKTVVGYGAPAKGNTLLNYCGVGTDFIPYTVDRSPYKQGHLLPGTHIPVEAPEKIRETRPDYVLILPWNLRSEIMQQMSYIQEWGGRFVVPIPRTEIHG
jgi:hypothetical protein